MEADKLNLVLCWHMHQPEYREGRDGPCRKPWTWLHGIKDYTDMAAHLESVPGAKAVVNFSTILLEQIADYAARIESALRHGQAIGDPLLDALAGTIPAADSARQALTRACLHAHQRHMIEAFAPYAALAHRAERALAQDRPLDDTTLRDLVVWYCLAWTGESVRREQVLVRDLIRRGGGYTADDASALLGLAGRLLADLAPRYARLADRGVVELSMTPHAHPILPLLIDPRAALDAMPGAPLPRVGYPGGTERCRWHIARGLELFEQHFGRRPQGCWPAEGGVSEAVLPLLEEAGFAWTATGAKVLDNTLGKPGEQAHFQCWQAGRGHHPLAIFFRDDQLSDRIGFEYANWDAGDAVADFVARIEAIRAAWRGPSPPVVSIIMDGENAWEHYPYNAWHFLQGLYSRLAAHPGIALTTFSALVENQPPRVALPRLAAGSWVYGNFAIWIGDAEKNHAWELLAEAKQAVDRVFAGEVLAGATRAAILEQLAVCEGSDWFWWLGGDNSAENRIDFDHQLRRQLAILYQQLGQTPPRNLQTAVTPQTPQGAAAGSMRRAHG